MACAMGIDLGTSSLKVMIVDSGGRVLAESSRRYQFDAPRPGWAEQDAGVWWNACVGAVREALAKLGERAAPVGALGFSGQMHGLVPLDRERRVIRPAILHCDTRSAAVVEGLRGRAALFPPFNPVYTGFLLCSLLWMREHEPEQYRRIDRVCLPKDFLKLKLCGELSGDYSDASGTLAFDLERLEWAAPLLEKLDLPEAWFPPCFEAAAVVGRVSAAAAAETGLAEGTPVVSGGGDQVMQAIGNGAIQSGQATVNIGSSGQVCFQSDRAVANPALTTNTFCGYGRGRWIVMGATMTAGLSLKWLNRLFAGADFQQLDDEAAALPPGAGGVLFLPWLSGERTPFVNPELSGAFLGLSLSTEKAHLVRAVMEGVAFSLYQCYEVCGGLGLHASELIASGGGARSRVWLQIIADLFGLPLKTAVLGEQACLGAAAAAFTGAGVFGSVAEAVSRLVRYKPEPVEPIRSHHDTYAAFYRQYQETYPAIGGVLQNLTRLRPE
ncbi:MAG: xylulokinase [Spirochaetaceae bacterium]|jgi:xylulokinase|nr:xylulokinase [Spirochaetaceae bacterium]